MVFVRVRTIKGSITAEQKRHLGVQLIAAIAKVEGLVDNDTRKLTSGVQIFELDPENWYLGSDDGDSLNKWQVDVITPQKLLQTPNDARRMVTTVRSVIPDWDGFRARLAAESPEAAKAALDLVYTPDRTVG
ncbi:tautomerase family protein [Mycobacteroides abscessus]|uniref:tautomerase family protein n=1 Tax=Mycobacteroides abscessus TaxID=36809 RepID=UPI00092984E8|nr:hypothetical protein [Mycobacteroides abscessus]SHQ39765.1 Uncharacterised protein [Mycobacteroides abscessus subsp. abscessus]